MKLGLYDSKTHNPNHSVYNSKLYNIQTHNSKLLFIIVNDLKKKRHTGFLLSHFAFLCTKLDSWLIINQLKQVNHLLTNRFLTFNSIEAIRLAAVLNSCFKKMVPSVWDWNRIERTQTAIVFRENIQLWKKKINQNFFKWSSHTLSLCLCSLAWIFFNSYCTYL